jgi:hypothetical protein
MRVVARPLLLLIMVSVLSPLASNAQVGVALYPVNNSIGFKTSNLKPVSAELRLNYDVSHSTADLLYIFQPEANFIYRIKREERINFYAGLGGGYGLNSANGNFKSASLLLGIEFFPIPGMKNFTLTAELDPNAKFYTGYETYKMTGLIGISYYFSKTKNG